MAVNYNRESHPGMPVTSRVRLAGGRSARLPTDPRLARDAHSAQEDT